MDIEKLIERLRENTDCWTDKVHGYTNLRLEAATALSTLQAENEKLRDELGKVKAERDAAVKRLMEWEKFSTYLLVHNFLPPEDWKGIEESECR